jgi:uncharacterized RDD family membrane protein YckC
LFDEQSHLPERSGFWRRFGALVVDAFIIAIGLQLLGIPAYAVSGGHVQSNIAHIDFCYHLDDSIPPGLKIPPGFQAKYVYYCEHRLFGLPTGRSVAIYQQPQPHPGTNVYLTVPVDAYGKPLSGNWLDLQWLLILALLGFRIGCEREHGQTTGKRVMRVRVVQIVPGTGGFSAAAKRNLAFFLPVQFFPLAKIGAPLWLVLIGFAVFCAAIVWQIVSRRDTYYDKAAGTAVVRATTHSPPVSVRAPAA